MDLEMKKTVEAFSAENFEEAKELLRVLGKIPAPSHEEELRAEFCSQWFRDQGFHDVSVDCAKNVICKLGPQDGDLVVFAAHMDVVFSDKTPLPMVEKDGKLHCPGIGDDTANLVNLMFAARWMLAHEKDMKQGLLIVANSCEEGLGNLDGTKQLFRDYGSRIKAFYSLDGKLGNLCNGAVGSQRFKVTCRTVGGHSYAAFGNPNAIVHMAHLIEDLCRVTLPTEAKTTYNVGTIEGGSTVNSIAQKAVMLYEFRSPSQNCLNYMRKFFDATVAAHQSEDAHFDVEVIGIRPGDGDLDREKLAAFTERSAALIREFCSTINLRPSSTDSNVPLSMGIMANTIGTIHNEGAHSREEWVELDSLATGLKLALSLMLSSQEL